MPLKLARASVATALKSTAPDNMPLRQTGTGSNQDADSYRDQAVDREREYIFEERLGISAGTRQPTQGEIDDANKEADAAAERIKISVTENK